MSLCFNVIINYFISFLISFKLEINVYYVP